MIDTSGDLITQPARRRTAPGESVWRRDPEFTLASGLTVRASASGGILYCLSPLMAMRVDAIGYSLLSGLSVSKGRTAAELADGVPGLSPVSAAEFLDDLTERRLLVRKPGEIGIWPSVTIVIPAYGRPDATRVCVNSLLELDYPTPQLEIIVVDDASDPPLAPTLADLPVRLLNVERNIGQSAARNLAAAEASGDVLAFIDNDCVATPTWLRELVPYLADPTMAMVGGRIVAPPPTGMVAAYEAVCSPLDMGPTEGTVGPDEVVAYLPTCNLLVRRDVLLAEGGFDTEMRLGEDVDFVWRVLRSGGRAHYAAAGEIVHEHRVRLGALLRRRIEYASSEADLQCRHPENTPVLHLPRTDLLALAALTAASIFWPLAMALALLTTGLGVVELATKRRQIRRMELNVPTRRLATSVLRGHAAALYHLGRHITRYYGLPLLAISLVWLPLLPAAAVLMIVPPVWDHRRLRPQLSLPAFVGLFWLDTGAYQLGVWRGCVARGRWRSLFPAIRWRR